MQYYLRGLKNLNLSHVYREFPNSSCFGSILTTEQNMIDWGRNSISNVLFMCPITGKVDKVYRTSESEASKGFKWSFDTLNSDLTTNKVASLQVRSIWEF